MPKKANAKRYAQAVFEIALETKTLDQWQTDLQKLAGALQSPELREALESPRITFEDKSRLLERLGGVNTLVLNLVRLLIVRDAVGMMGQVAAEYERLLNEHRGIQKAKVVTAVAIDEKEKARIEKDLGALVGAKVMVEPEVDPAILGGVIARVEGKLLDGSTRTKLENLKRRMAGEGSE
ncbi:MAG TPA: ATP synthase F1 subunit delta [Dehalococcoidales bacterium]|nr:ATP synthase F1 subunit delta [Dehalococcoidales bacterium]